MEVRVPIEIDITYTNHTWFSMRKPNKKKFYVLGIFRRGYGKAPGFAIIKTLKDNSQEEIKQVLVETVQKGAMLYAEEKILSDEVKEMYEVYEFNVAEDGHVKGDIHVNNVKNMWRDLKRNIKREHIQVSQKHLQLYCSEVAWRINHRHLSPAERFEAALQNLSIPQGKKRTFEDLTK